MLEQTTTYFPICNYDWPFTCQRLILTRSLSRIYIYIFVLIGRGRSLTLLLANQFRALISHLDSRTCTAKPYWFVRELILVGRSKLLEENNYVLQAWVKEKCSRHYTKYRRRSRMKLMKLLKGCQCSGTWEQRWGVKLWDCPKSVYQYMGVGVVKCWDCKKVKMVQQQGSGSNLILGLRQTVVVGGS